MFLVLSIFADLYFPVEEEHAARPYAVLRATLHVIVDPVAKQRFLRARAANRGPGA
jgi:hypothetical protein